MKKLTALPLLCLCLNLIAQSNEQKPGPMAAVYHGFVAGTNYNRFLYNSDRPSFNFGYSVDIRLTGPLWLFCRFGFDVYHDKYEVVNIVHDETETSTTKNRYLDFEIPIKLAWQTGKKDAKLQFYPSLGAGVYFPLYYNTRQYTNHVRIEQSQGYRNQDFINAPAYVTAAAGIEAKWQYSKKHHVALGLGYNYVFRAENTVPVYTSAFVKFGWNKYKKEKKKAE